MNAILFENFWMLFTLGAICSVIAITAYILRLTDFTRRCAWIVPCVFIVLLTVNRWVLTDEEAIERTVLRSFDAFILASPDRLADELDPSFFSGPMKREDVIREIKTVMDRLTFKSIRAESLTIDAPKAHLIVWSHVGAGKDAGPVRTEWDLEFVQTPDGRWLYKSAKPLKIQNQEVHDLMDMIGEARSF